MDRLSDDLLRHILSFASSKDAASTSALSRRWRWIWHSTGALNLETRVPSFTRLPNVSAYHEHEALCFSHRAAFVSAAEKALDASVAAAGFPVTRLTLCVEADNPGNISRYMYGRGGIDSKSLDVVAKLLLHPAAQCVEELVLAPGNACRSLDDDFEVMPTNTQFYGHYLGSVLPVPGTLRALDVTGYSEFTLPGTGALPRLASLRLILCSVQITQFQGVIDAVPALTSVHLDSVHLYTGKDNSLPQSPEEALTISLRFPSATAIILEKCTWLKKTIYHSSRTSLEIYVPRLRRFRYKGLIRQISVSSPALDFDRVDLHFLPDPVYPKAKVPWRETFWRLLRNFTRAKELKVRVNDLEDIAVLATARQVELLCAFRNLERLEVEGVHRPKGKTAAVAIANLLRCCPVVVDLRIKLNRAQSDSTRYCQYGKLLLERKHQSDFNRSMDSFKRRRSKPTFYMGDDDDAKYDEVSGIPGLIGRIFHCLQTSVRRVGLQFRLEETNCLGLGLIKFLAENALVLEEMRIDSGNRKMCEHINFAIERWIAKKRKTSFRVLPLER